MAKKTNREVITMACQNKKDDGTTCKQQNYTTKKNKKNTSDRLVLKKYCKYCKTKADHKELKK